MEGISDSDIEEWQRFTMIIEHPNQNSDSIVWNHDSSGIFSVKSATKTLYTSSSYLDSILVKWISEENSPKKGKKKIVWSVAHSM